MMRRPLAREIIAMGFYRKNAFNIKRGLRHLKGIDFEYEVEVKALATGTELKQYQACEHDGAGEPIPRQGNYYAQDDVAPEHLGINPRYRLASGAESDRIVHIYVLKAYVEVLCSRVKAIVDTWSIPDTPFHAVGGGTQIFCSSGGCFELKPT